MALKIISPTDPITVDQLVVAIYAQPGSGRTTIGYTADRALVFDFDQGSHRSAFRTLGDTVRPTRWADVQLTADELGPYDTVVLDTIGRALEMLAVHLIEKDPKLARSTGDLALQGYGALKSVFARWVGQVKSSGCDLVFCCHMDEQQKGDRTIERLDCIGGTRQEVYKVSDLMGKLTVGVAGKRLLDFRPGETSFGKDPVGLGLLDVPVLDTLDDKRWLGGLIRGAKAKLNEMTEDQRKLQAERDDFADMVTATEEPAELTDLMKAANGDSVMRAIVARRAKELNLVVDQEQKCFVKPEPAVIEGAEKHTPAVAAKTSTAAEVCESPRAGNLPEPPAEPADTSLPDPKAKPKPKRNPRKEAQQQRLENVAASGKAPASGDREEMEF